MERAETDVTQTPAFKRWFAGSKVVDAQGRPQVVYRYDKKFRFLKVLKDRKHGIYFTTFRNVARSYAPSESSEQQHIHQAYLRAINPLTIDAEGQNWNSIDADKIVQKAWRDGHDAVIFENIIDHGASTVVLEPATTIVVRKASQVWSDAIKDPAQIKSAIGNKGNFDPSNPDITESKTRRLIESLLESRDDIGKLPLPAAAKAYARRKGIKSMLRQPKDFERVNALLTNPGRPNRFSNREVGTYTDGSKVK